MANTNALKRNVEPYVREWLASKFGKPFRSEFLPFTGAKGREGNPARHEFDAVSEDRKIVCGIKTASWKTSSGKRGSGKVHGAYAELYFLDHVDAEARYLVLTDPEFFENLKRDSEGKLATGIELLYCKLSDELKVQVDAIRTESRRELGS
jgi:hypothetical protein